MALSACTFGAHFLSAAGAQEGKVRGRGSEKRERLGREGRREDRKGGVRRWEKGRKRGGWVGMGRGERDLWGWGREGEREGSEGIHSTVCVSFF